MEERTKNNYRWLLYAMCIEIRGGSGSLWSLRRWVGSELRKRQDLADAFHNLAHFSSLDFAGFEPSSFWRELARLPRRPMFDYRAIFDSMEAGEKGSFIPHYD